jgi:hypothetical protein
MENYFEHIFLFFEGAIAYCNREKQGNMPKETP